MYIVLARPVRQRKENAYLTNLFQANNTVFVLKLQFLLKVAISYTIVCVHA